MPQGSSKIESGDHVVVVLRPALRPQVDHVFSRQFGTSEAADGLPIQNGSDNS